METHEHIRVLLVEDHADTAELIQRVLSLSRAPWFEVRCAGSLGEAFAFAEPPAGAGVILLDLSLPDSRGFETFAAAHRRWPSTPIIVLTATDDEDLALRAVREGAQDYLPKGEFKFGLLVRAIRYAVGRAHAELTLARERSLLRNLIDALPDEIYVKDLEGRFVLANRATHRALSVAGDEELVGLTDADLFPPEAAAAFRAEEQALIRSGLPIIERESPVPGGGGEGAAPAWVRTHKVPMRDTDGRVTGIVGVNRDITERRRARDQLEQANLALAERQRELEAAVEDLRRSHQALQASHAALRATQLQLVQAEKMESIGRLAAGIAHEVKNPLAVVKLSVDLLARRLAGSGNPPGDGSVDGPGDGPDGGPDGAGLPGLRPVLHSMADAVRRAEAVVRGLLDFAAPGTLTLADASVREVAGRALLLVRHELMRAHAAVRDEVPEDLPPVRVDVAKIEQVLVNLLINAAHATPPGGTVTVRGRAGPYAQACDGDGGDNPAAAVAAARFAPDQQVVVLEVDDTGPGIAEDHLGNLFEPFFTTKPLGKGSGLGLSVCNTIMELHGGAVYLRNRPGGGARATLVFNAERDVSWNPNASESSSSTTSRTSPRSCA